MTNNFAAKKPSSIQNIIVLCCYFTRFFWLFLDSIDYANVFAILFRFTFILIKNQKTYMHALGISEYVRFTLDFVHSWLLSDVLFWDTFRSMAFINNLVLKYDQTVEHLRRLAFTTRLEFPDLPSVFLMIFIRQRHVSNSHENWSFDRSVLHFVNLFEILVPIFGSNWDY